MRTLFFFLFIVFASTCMMWSAMFTGKDIVVHSLIALGLWGVFLLYWSRQQRKKRLKEQNEAMFNAYSRDRMKRW
jgi:Flp pilus assembly protein TadB